MPIIQYGLDKTDPPSPPKKGGDKKLLKVPLAFGGFRGISGELTVLTEPY